MLVDQLNLMARESVHLDAETCADTPSSTAVAADDAELAHVLRETPAWTNLRRCVLMASVQTRPAQNNLAGVNPASNGQGELF